MQALRSPRMSIKRVATAAFKECGEYRLQATGENGPKLLDFKGSCDCQGVLKFNTQISDCAVHLGVPK